MAKTIQPIEVKLPITAGAIPTDDVRKLMKTIITNEIGSVLVKYGIKDYNIQLAWPDTDDATHIEVWSSTMGYLKRFLGSILARVGQAKTVAKVNFVREIVEVIDNLGYFQTLVTVTQTHMAKRSMSADERKFRDEDEDEEGEGE
jgi:hypothetical protein